MHISTKGRYALRLMIDLAQHNTGENISLRDISRRQDISVKYLEQIVGVLCKAGLIKSVRGAQGGYRLVKAPENYTAGEILRATEGSLAPVSCLENEPNQCPRAGACHTLPFWQGLHQAVTCYVDSISLADLVNQQPQAPDFSI